MENGLEKEFLDFMETAAENCLRDPATSSCLVTEIIKNSGKPGYPILGQGMNIDLRSHLNADDAICQLRTCFTGVQACDDLGGLVSQACDTGVASGIGGFVAVGLVILIGFVSVTCLRHQPFGALVRKNFLLTRHKFFKSTLLQLFELALLSVLVVVIQLFTDVENHNSTLFSVDPLGSVWISYSTPDSIRSKIFEILVPFGGLIFLIVFTYPIATIIISFVMEKETNMKESLRVAGMRDFDFTASWYVTILIKSLPLCVAVAVLVEFGGLFPNQTFTSSAFFFFCFVFELIGFSQLLTVFFNSTTRVAALFAVLFSYVTFFFSLAQAVSEATASQKLGYCFLPSLCFTFGVAYDLMSAKVLVGVDVAPFIGTIDQPPTEDCCVYMIVWGCLYSLMAWYLEYVIPQKHGIRYHFSFPLSQLKAWWQRRPCSRVRRLWRRRRHSVESSLLESLSTSPVGDRSFNSDLSCEHGLEISNLCKTYKVPALENGVREAVKDLSLSVPVGTVVILLGHNGAGKSTTFKMLTGMLEPTSGDVNAFGNSIRGDMPAFRRNMGFVPQSNILYSALTVTQHLELVCVLRGKRFRVAEYEAVLIDLDLKKKMSTAAGSLSGGQKRKLSLAMALMGDTRLLFLDEVSSGVDPDSRTKFWDVIRKYGKDRIVVCTTHFLDEADYLGDKVAVLVDGKLEAYDSPSSLKLKYGSGARLSFSCKDPRLLQQLQHELTDKVLSYLPAAKISESFKSVDFDLPLSVLCNGSSSPPPSEGDQESEVSDRTRKDQQGNSAQLSLLLQAVEGETPFKEAGVQATLEAPSLEDVFLSLTKAHSASSYQDLAKPSKRTACKTLRALVRKKWLRSRRDWPMWLGVLVVSALFSLLPLMLGHISVGSFAGAVFFDANPVCEAKISSFVPQPGNVARCAKCEQEFDAGEASYSYVYNCCCGIFGCQEADTSNCCSRTKYESSDKMKDCVKEQQRPQCPTFGDILYCEDKMYLHCDEMPWLCNKASCCDYKENASPFYACQTSNLYRQILYGPSVIPTVSCPTKTLSQYEGYVNALVQSLCITFALSFGAMPVIAAAVTETESQAHTKNAQLLSGVSPFLYWISTYLFDQTYYLLIGFFTAACYSRYNGPQSVELQYTQVTTLEIFLFCCCIVPVCYALSFHFDMHTKALVYLITTSLILGVGLPLVCSILAQLNFVQGLPSGWNSGDLVTWAELFLNFFPQYCLSAGIINSLQMFYLSTIAHRFRTPLVILDTIFGTFYADDATWSPWPDGIFRLAYLLFVTLLAWLYVFVKEAKPRCCSHCGILRRRWKSHASAQLGDHKDVRNERNRMSAHAATDVIQLRDVSKGYSKHDTLSLDGLSFGVPRSEIFGFLGANGAGKSTTLNILSGTIAPSSGNAMILGINANTHANAARRHLGYCTQTDNLFANLTVAEHLEIFAAIYGHVDIAAAVNTSLSNLQLAKYRHVKTVELSGGNKRKLMAALTLLGMPEALVLDEPSSGMDPAAQRFLWNTVKNVRKAAGSAVVLVSHSFPEIEALCDRVAMICEGRLRCIGPSQYLSTRFGKYLAVEVTFSTTKGYHDEASFNELCATITEALQERYGQSAKIMCTKGLELVEFGIDRTSGVTTAEVCAYLQQQVFVGELGGRVSAFGISWGRLSEVFSGWIDDVEKLSNNMQPIE